MEGIAKKIVFLTNKDERGALTVVENQKQIPFDMKRLFYIYGVKDEAARGNHANINSEFVMAALAGSVRVKIDDGNQIEEHILNNPAEGIYIPKMTWKVMDEFSEDCVLLVMSNELYDNNEYIRDYDQFKEKVLRR